MSNQKYLRAKALVVGIDQYDQATHLDNAVNDAKAVANVLRQLKFYVYDYYNIDTDQWDIVFPQFYEDLSDFDACVFFFCRTWYRNRW